jgi:5-formyltetrahydrofolate cyclo-ligase
VDLDHRAELRARLRAERAALSPRARVAAATAMARQLGALAELTIDESIAGYWAVRGELALNAVIPPLIARGQRFHLPVLRADRERPLGFVPWRPGEAVAPNRFGIPEPVLREPELAPDAMQLVLVPLVAFDRRGARLGSGAGYYDRAFAFLREGERPREPLLVGIAYALQELDGLPHDAWDVALDFVCTERELIECRR